MCQTNLKKSLYLLVGILTVLLTVACGGAGTEAAVGNGTAAVENNDLFAESDSSDLSDFFAKADSEAVDEAPGQVVPLPTAAVAEETENEDTEAAESEAAAAAEPSTRSAIESTVGADGIPVGYLDVGRPYRGDLDAPILIEEFSDFQCPFCARFSSQTLPSLLENQIANGEVLLVYYDLPLTNIHPQARLAANAARCAGSQGAVNYWAYHDMLFARDSEWANNQAQTVFAEFAAELGLETDAFVDCLAEGRFDEGVSADMALAAQRGVRSTPSFFLNGQMLVGAQPIETFNQAIATLQNGEELAQAQPQPQPGPEDIQIPQPVDVSLAPETIAFAMGDPDAPVQIVEYTDYQCPFCQRYSQETLPQIISEMVEQGRVYYVFKDFPLDNLHPDARAAAKAVRCGGEQDAFLAMHDAVFDAQQAWAGRTEGRDQLFAQMASELDLDSEAFAACYADDAMDALVQDNLVEGQSYNVTGTPAFFIDGYLMSGAQPYDTFSQVVTWAENGELAAQIEASVRAAYAQQQQQQQQPEQPPQPTGPVDVSVGDGYAIGDPNAPVTIIEYTDFQCPFCSRHNSQTLPTLIEEYVNSGQVYYVFKDFPLTSIHPQAFIAAEAGRCAREQDNFLEMHDTLFARQGDWNGRNDAAAIFTGYAADLGLDSEAFATCLSEHRYEAVVQAELDEGLALGIRGTPTFFLNGHLLSGAQPLNVFEQAIAQLSGQN